MLGAPGMGESVCGNDESVGSTVHGAESFGGRKRKQCEYWARAKLPAGNTERKHPTHTHRGQYYDYNYYDPLYYN